ncbi:MAG: threonine ammonia-lyase [Bdellovibrionia bacterium]
MKVTLEDIIKAQTTLKEIINKTELSKSISASKLLGCDVYFKYENTQRTGSFKIRGAYNKISHLSPQEKANGVVASSAGNHAQGVALSATLAGVKSTIVMPENAPLNKITATQSYGAEVVLKGEIYDDAYEHARFLEKEKGYTFVHPYEDPHVIAGQGTIGLEIAEQLSDLDTIVIPIGGGGLISGIATAIKAKSPKTKIIGVQSVHAPGMAQLFLKQSATPSNKKVATIADGIAIKKPSQVMYDSFISKLVDDVVTVNDDEIAAAIVYLLERAKTVTEGSGAAAMAAAMSRSLPLGKKTCILLCGGNIDLNIVAKVIEKGQIARGRLVELSVVVDDFPGSLAKLTAAIAEQKANVLEVKHDRIKQGLYLRETKIDFVLETTSHEHVEKIKAALLACGGRIL